MTTKQDIERELTRIQNQNGLGRLEVFSTSRACPVCATSYPELDPRLFSYNSKHGWCPDCVGTGLALSREQRKALDDSVRDDGERGREQSFAEPDVEDLADRPCPSCEGTRLNAQARAVKFGGVGITDVARLSVNEVRKWVRTLMGMTPNTSVRAEPFDKLRTGLSKAQGARGPFDRLRANGSGGVGEASAATAAATAPAAGSSRSSA